MTTINAYYSKIIAMDRSVKYFLAVEQGGNIRGFITKPSNGLYEIMSSLESNDFADLMRHSGSKKIELNEETSALAQSLFENTDKMPLHKIKDALNILLIGK